MGDDRCFEVWRQCLIFRKRCKDSLNFIEIVNFSSPFILKNKLLNPTVFEAKSSKYSARGVGCFFRFACHDTLYAYMWCVNLPDKRMLSGSFWAFFRRNSAIFITSTHMSIPRTSCSAPRRNVRIYMPSQGDRRERDIYVCVLLLMLRSGRMSPLRLTFDCIELSSWLLLSLLEICSHRLENYWEIATCCSKRYILKK